MDKLSKAIQVLEDQINYSVRNMDEVSVELDFESADVILELLKEQQTRAVKNVHRFGDVVLGDCPSCGDRVLKASCPKFCGKCGEKLDWTKAGEQE